MTSDAKEEGLNYSYNHYPTHHHNTSVQSGNQDETSANAATMRGTGLVDARSTTTTTSHVLFFKVLFFISITSLTLGIFCGNMGRWTRSGLGFTGMFLVGLAALLMVVIGVNSKRFQHRTSVFAAYPAAGSVGGTMNPNLTVPTVTLQEGITTPSEAGVIETNAVQSGGVARVTQCYLTQSGYPVGTTLPPDEHPLQSDPGTPHQHPPNGPRQYAQPHADPQAVSMPYPQPGVPPMSYQDMHLPPPPDGYLGVAQPGSGVNELPPPPSYDDLFPGN